MPYAATEPVVSYRESIADKPGEVNILTSFVTELCVTVLESPSSRGWRRLVTVRASIAVELLAANYDRDGKNGYHGRSRTWSGAI